jgi:lysophospholipase L1-like esterase
VVAFLGDSFTAGALATSPEDFWTSEVCAAFGWDQRNFGEGGTGYFTAGRMPGAQPYMARVAAVVAADPSIVIVSGGLNDIGRSTDAQFVIAVDQTYSALRQALPHATIIAVNPFYDANPPPDRLATMASEVAAAAQAVGAVYLNVGDPLLGLTADIGADGVHPNDAGHAALAGAFERAYERR